MGIVLLFWTVSSHSKLNFLFYMTTFGEDLLYSNNNHTLFCFTLFHYSWFLLFEPWSPFLFPSLLPLAATLVWDRYIPIRNINFFFCLCLYFTEINLLVLRFPPSPIFTQRWFTIHLGCICTSNSLLLNASHYSTVCICPTFYCLVVMGWTPWLPPTPLFRKQNRSVCSMD